MKNITKLQLILAASLIIMGFFVFTSNSQGYIQPFFEDEEDEEDESGGDDGDDLPKALGLTAIILFGLVVSKALVFFINKYVRKLPDTTDSRMKFKNNTKTFFLKTRPVLRNIHYIAAPIALVLLYIHGLSLIEKSPPRTINGIITAVILTLYVLTGMIAKMKMKPFFNSKKWKKWIIKLHRSLPIFAFFTVFHIIHLFLED